MPTPTADTAVARVNSNASPAESRSTLVSVSGLTVAASPGDPTGNALNAVRHSHHAAPLPHGDIAPRNWRRSAQPEDYCHDITE
ncbi:MAG: hypothetical protein ACRDSM_23175, partial [Pseudonocardiaceae bacterium]